MSTTLKDLANFLGLSVSTVSRALNNKGRMSEETRSQILKAAQDLQYIPNASARSLKTNSNPIVGVLLPDISNIFYTKLLQAIDLELNKAGYGMLFCNTDDDFKKERQYMEMLLSQNVAGTIFAPSSAAPHYEQEKFFQNIIYIDNMPSLSRSDYSFVGIDNIRAGYELTSMLFETGHKNIVAVTGTVQETTAIHRMEGFCRKMEEQSVDISHRIFSGPYTINAGYDIVMRMLNLPTFPDAIFVHNNVQVYGIIHALMNLRKKIPEDVSIVSFDFMDDTKLIQPQITSVLQPVSQLAAQAVQLVIEPEQAKNHPNIILNHTIYMGASLCNKPPRH
ncbi:LacI family transcriptional regulator [Eubacterium sp. am_0171]|uniref:LacI family DNA-binding transcriptional regulator n=1 Tax=unclassified Eubacterium (in: firmicutes) TaxID=2624479 RepID=UPI001021F476|nr:MULTISPECIES: LacI family DNA-binding transcriptional regulator [unclassified Eubacterium (in: firmicutes)]MSC86399.1 LacI family DNA-binding transcriptional regulator [Eubacterium sp. BIOML-A1]MSD08689.1 LacI family DNA-binding transcriptional regulator [Eubacterium sp. BIOML-A2]RYT11602.1 LacI family transcriptional regulator [Eubacterium sp. am_0171]